MYSDCKFIVFVVMFVRKDRKKNINKTFEEVILRQFSGKTENGNWRRRRRMVSSLMPLIALICRPFFFFFCFCFPYLINVFFLADIVLLCEQRSNPRYSKKKVQTQLVATSGKKINKLVDYYFSHNYNFLSF